MLPLAETGDCPHHLAELPVDNGDVGKPAGAKRTASLLVEPELACAQRGCFEDSHLRAEQLCEVKTLYQAKLDPDLEIEVKERCPHLLEFPEEPDETDE